MDLLPARVDATPVVRRGCREEGRRAGKGQGVPPVEQMENSVFGTETNHSFVFGTKKF